MKDSLKSFGSIIVSKLVFGNPLITLSLFACVVIFFMLLLVLAEDDSDEGGIDNDAQENIYGLCEPVDIEDNEDWTVEYIKGFEGKGLLSDSGQFYLDSAFRYNIDPVLLASISFLETAHGKSEMLKTKNNPGGLYNSAKKEFFEFSSLQEGVDRMASNLYDNYISKGLFTIEQIGNKYAPLGVENDPNNLNANWIPIVTDISNQFGGLIMNCEAVNFGKGEFAHPIPDAIITSSYGVRVDPITGATGDMHKGIDYGCSAGQAIYSAQQGTVVDVVNGCQIGDSNCGGGYGNRVVLNHGSNYTLYAHLTGASVTMGQTVDRSAVIGSCGTTGSSTGNHLHFEVMLDLFGERVDPQPFVESGDG